MTVFMDSLPDEIKAELMQDDNVVVNVSYRNFVSKSKGRRNGKQRKRKGWKDIELVNYRNGWHLLHNSRMDVMNQELTHEVMSMDEFISHVQDNCLPNRLSIW